MNINEITRMTNLSRFVKKTKALLGVVMCAICLQNCAHSSNERPHWPSINRETKPWTRWWWQGNALTKEGITAEMEAYQKAGIGGLEITPIYGVVGYENKFVDYLSPEWMELLLYTLKEAERLDIGIDMATGTGWPFGGPWVTEEDACKDMNYKMYEVKGGAGLSEKIEFVQQPYLRIIGNPVYGSPDQTPEMNRIAVKDKELTIRLDPKKVDISQVKYPVALNKNLQALAIEQIKFEKPLSLKVVMGYGSSGEVLNLTSKVGESGKLNWTAPAGDWKLYAIFEGWHGKMVERAGPGGEGNVIDHFSTTAVEHYLSRIDSAFKGKDTHFLRAFFNDSYEVDDARGTADWTPTLFDEFARLKGYDLREHLPALFAKDDDEKNKRVLCDYRETISELLLNNFTKKWKVWAHGNSAIIRNQAHGSPSNILDLYATVDIPEIEGEDPLRIKMASSAANVTGKRLVSSESATWLNEHFKSNLGEIKIAVDRFMLNGVNHIFYHGTCYSPPGEPWPGWLFYAAVHLNPRNPQWKDFDALNNYIARCQSFLQNTKPDNDVLLYYPIYDRFSTPGNEMLEHFDGIGKQFVNTPFERAAKSMQVKGYAFDYISDKQIEALTVKNGDLNTEGNSAYKTIVIPRGQYIPISTFKKIVSLAEEGATVIMAEGLPGSVSGYSNLNKNLETFESLMKKLASSTQEKDNIKEIKAGKGKILIGDSVNVLLSYASIRKEEMVDNGIDFTRKKKSEDQNIYLIANRKDQFFSGWIPLSVNASSAVMYDPMSGEWGVAKTRQESKNLEVYVQLTQGQSLIVETYKSSPDGQAFRYYDVNGPSVSLSGKWKIAFLSGGPEIPDAVEIDTLSSWTSFGEKNYPAFSGTASYTLTFEKPNSPAKGWLLDLGIVNESAEVFINDKPMGTLIGPTYQLHVDASDLKDSNVLVIEVSNLMANRIADMDRRKIFWKKFYNVNFPARKAENRKNGLFDASDWYPEDSGLLGPVRLIPLEK
jgi:alpha-L-rhamnosidase